MTRRIDVHTHLVPAGLVERAAALGGTGVSARDGRLIVDGVEVGPAELYDPGALLRSLDRRGLDRACVSIPPPLYRQGLPPVEARAWTTAVNESLSELAAEHPERLAALVHLPIEQPAVALAEAEGRGSDGAGFAIASHAPGVSLAGPDLRPLWEVLDARHAVVFVHPARPEDPRLERWYLSNLLGNPYETALAAAHLVFGSVLDRFENIRFCLAHAGGAAAAVAGRWQQGYATRRPGIPPSRPPAELLRRLYVDCIAFSQTYLDLAQTVFGDDHVVLGSDWPFPMGLEDARLAELYAEKTDRLLDAGAGRARHAASSTS